MLSYDITVKRYILNDKKLKGAEKLFYVHLLGLISHLGYCWATNGYLAEAAQVTTRQVQRYLEKLKKINYIKVILIRDKCHRVTERRIYTRQTFSERGDIERVYGESEFFQKGFRNDMDVVTPHDMDVVYIEHNSTYKKKGRKEGGVGETKPQVLSRPAALDPPFSKKNKEKEKTYELTPDDRKELEAKIGKELKKYEDKRLAHLMKCPKSLHHNKLAKDTILQFYQEDQKERLLREKARNESKSQASISRAEKGRKLVKDVLKDNPYHAEVLVECKDYAELGKSNGITPLQTVAYDDPELYQKIEDLFKKLQRYDGVEYKMPKQIEYLE